VVVSTTGLNRYYRATTGRPYGIFKHECISGVRWTPLRGFQA